MQLNLKRLKFLLLEVTHELLLFFFFYRLSKHSMGGGEKGQKTLNPGGV